MTQTAEDVVVGLALVIRLDRRRAAVAHVGHAAVNLENRALDGARARQDVIGDGAGRRDVVIENHDEVKAHQRLEHAVRVSIGEQRVGRVHDEGAHAVGLARFHGVQHQMGACRCHVTLGKAPAELLGLLAHHLVAVEALQRRIRRVQAERALFGRQQIGQLEIDLAREIAGFGHDARSLAVDVARHGAQAADGAVRGSDRFSGLVNAAAADKRRAALRASLTA